LIHIDKKEKKSAEQNEGNGDSADTDGMNEPIAEDIVRTLFKKV
jgi:hypothetical protein